MTTLLPVCVEMTNLSDHNRLAAPKSKKGPATAACGRTRRVVSSGFPGGPPCPSSTCRCACPPDLPTYPGNPAVRVAARQAHRAGRQLQRVGAEPRHPHRHSRRRAPPLLRRTGRASTSCRWTCWWAPRGSSTSRASAPSRPANCKTSTCGVSPGCSSGPTTRHGWAAGSALQPGLRLPGGRRRAPAGRAGDPAAWESITSRSNDSRRRGAHAPRPPGPRGGSRRRARPLGGAAGRLRTAVPAAEDRRRRRCARARVV